MQTLVKTPRGGRDHPGREIAFKRTIPWATPAGGRPDPGLPRIGAWHFPLAGCTPAGGQSSPRGPAGAGTGSKQVDGGIDPLHRAEKDAGDVLMRPGIWLAASTNMVFAAEHSPRSIGGLVDKLRPRAPGGQERASMC